MSTQRMPDAELEVLACLWQGGPATAMQIQERLRTSRPLSHASVMTLLRRLETKGLVQRGKSPVGKSYLFRPSSKTSPTIRHLVKQFVQRVFAGDPVQLVNCLFEDTPPTPEQLENLRKLLLDQRDRSRRTTRERP